MFCFFVDIRFMDIPRLWFRYDMDLQVIIDIFMGLPLRDKTIDAKMERDYGIGLFLRRGYCVTCLLPLFLVQKGKSKITASLKAAFRFFSDLSDIVTRG